MNCTCFGHRELYSSIKGNLLDTLESLIRKYGAIDFMTGGMGESDRLFSECIRILKKEISHHKTYIGVTIYNM